MRQTLFSLLNAERGKKNPTGSVQVLWYELSEETDAINEFRKINTGKIYLTDAELIKALFLRTQSSEIQEQTQMQRALEWENIENTLHNDSFWYFLNKRGNDMPNRIDFIFQLIYRTEKLKDVDEAEMDENLKVCDAELKTKNRIFNFYYDKFDGLNGQLLAEKVETDWDDIKKVYHVLEDWYNDVVYYNLIGMLSQYHENLLPKSYVHFLKMDENQSRDDFKAWLKKQIRKQVEHIEVKDNQININYDDKDVFNLLLLLNVNHLNRQAENFKGQGDLGAIYKFPFAVLTNSDWDIEHVDSFTKNGLKEVKTQELWIKTALADLDNQMSDEEKEEVVNLQEEGRLVDVINRLRQIAKETEAAEEVKNNIGNLALLDSGTNRSYGNSLFITKRNVIIDRMKNGVYVPVSTSYVFMKLFDDSGNYRMQWTEKDMKEYQNYICKELSDYLKQ